MIPSRGLVAVAGAVRPREGQLAAEVSWMEWILSAAQEGRRWAAGDGVLREGLAVTKGQLQCQ